MVISILEDRRLSGESTLPFRSRKKIADAMVEGGGWRSRANRREWSQDKVETKINQVAAFVKEEDSMRSCC